MQTARAQNAGAPTPAPTTSSTTNVDVSTHLLRARQHFQDEKYNDAADEMLRAYELDQKPLYLFNAAQAYRKAQRYKEAFDLYKRYVKMAPTGPLVNEAQGHVQDMEALLKEQSTRQEVRLLLESEQADKKKQQEQLVLEQAEKKKAEERAEAERKKAQQAELALKKERNKPFYKKTWFNGIVGAGAAVVLGGIIIGAVVGSLARSDAGTIPVSLKETPQ